MELTAEPKHKTALDIFVFEEWTQIFQTLTDNADRWNASNADLLFRQIIQYQTENWITLLFHKTVPYLLKYLSRSDILALRATNMLWNNIIDQFLESDQRWRDANERGFQKVQLNLFQHSRLTRLQRYSSLVSALRAFPEAKIVGGAVNIDNAVDDNFQPIDFRPFFREFGGKVYHLSMRVKTPYTMDVISSWTMVADILCFTPNLKSLNLIYSVCGLDEVKLKNFIQERTLPPLKNLVSLRLEQYGHGFYTSVYTALPQTVAFLEAYGATLQCLNVKRLRGPIPVPEKLKSLLRLDCQVQNLDELEAVKCINAPLQHLNIHFHLGEYQSNYLKDHRQLLFAIMQKFAETLKCVHATSSDSSNSNLKVLYKSVCPPALKTFPSLINMS